jgi:hypothetical protein
MGSPTANVFNLLIFEISNFTRQKYIWFLAVPQLTLVAETPSVNRTVLGYHARKVISTANVNNFLFKLELFGHAQIFKTTNSKLTESIRSPNVHLSLIVQT